VPPDSGILSNVWVTAGDDLVQAQIVTGRGRACGSRIRPGRARGHHHSRIVDAERARPDGGGWLLEDVSIYDAA
jgi:lipopolysaccharide export system permease protein